MGTPYHPFSTLWKIQVDLHLLYERCMEQVPKWILPNDDLTDGDVSHEKLSVKKSPEKI